MKKTKLLLFVFTLFLGQFVAAQSIETITKKAAVGLCDCVNDTYDNIDDDVKEVMVKMIQLQVAGKEEEVDRYLTSFSPDMLERFAEQASLFESNDAMFQGCIENLGTEIENLVVDESSYEDMTTDDITNMIFSKMKAIKTCNFPYLLVQLGVYEGEKADDNFDNTNNSNNTKNTKNTKKLSNGNENGTGGN